MFPQKVSQNIDNLAAIYGNMFLQQSTPIVNKALFDQFLFQISFFYIYLFWSYEFPRLSNSGRHILYLFLRGLVSGDLCTWIFCHTGDLGQRLETRLKINQKTIVMSLWFLSHCAFKKNLSEKTHHCGFLCIFVQCWGMVTCNQPR